MNKAIMVSRGAAGTVCTPRTQFSGGEVKWYEDKPKTGKEAVK